MRRNIRFLMLLMRVRIKLVIFFVMGYVVLYVILKYSGMLVFSRSVVSMIVVYNEF